MSKKNFSLYGLPEHVVFCKSCVISNQRPSSVIEFKNADNPKKGIEIDDNQICSACKYNEIKKMRNPRIIRNSFYFLLLPRFGVIGDMPQKLYSNLVSSAPRLSQAA